MKTLNSKKIEVLHGKDGQPNGFVGIVQVYDENIYVDTRDGTGYDKVVNRLNPLIYKLASKYIAKYNFNSDALDDIKHDVIVYILEGIPKYNPEKNMKLSSFIQMRVNRRLINELRNKNIFSKNATTLNIRDYNILCNCGASFAATINIDDNFIECPSCKKNIDIKHKKYSISVMEINESRLNISDEEIDNISYTNNLKTAEDFQNDIIKAQDLEKWLENEDPRVVKIIELICLHDYSVSSAAEQVGLTAAGANLKLKSLKRKKAVRDFFNR